MVGDDLDGAGEDHLLGLTGGDPLRDHRDRIAPLVGGSLGTDLESGGGERNGCGGGIAGETPLHGSCPRENRFDPPVAGEILGGSDRREPVGPVGAAGDCYSGNGEFTAGIRIEGQGPEGDDSDSGERRCPFALDRLEGDTNRLCIVGATGSRQTDLSRYVDTCETDRFVDEEQSGIAGGRNKVGLEIKLTRDCDEAAELAHVPG
ncbi:unannotated protein [freshwater metagenome]|uniref:Unannotated protein n=1 Tax=freshwater metagenome TaxID=449393 RepID=A0A6J6GMS1_9ZZZZ